MATTIQIKRGTKASLDSISLLSGELGYTTDTNEVYVGDGTNNYLVGRVIVDTDANQPDAGVSGRMFYSTETSATSIDDGTQWVSISATVDESDIDHDLLYNYVANEHVDHTSVSILTSGIVSGGGDLTADRTITLNNSDVDHDQTTNFVSNEHIDHSTVSITTGAPLTGGGDLTANRTIDINLDSTDLGVDGSNNLYVKDAGIDHNSTTNVHQDVTTSASPTFAGVTISGSVTDGTDATTKDYVDGLIQGMDWQNSVIDRYDPNTGLPGTPTEGDRYISTATANGWTIDHIYEYDGTDWIEIEPNQGFSVWVEDENVQYTYNGTEWVKFASIYQHNNLSGLDGGDSGEYYHLSAIEFVHLDGQDQSVLTNSSVTFDDVSITTPGNIYNLDHDSFTGFVANEHIDHTSVSILTSGILTGGGDLTADRTITLNHSDVDHDQTTNFVANEHIDWTVTQTEDVHADNITEGSVTQHEAAINHDNLTGFVTNEHINHSNVSISTGNGLSGGGDLTANRTISINNDTTTGATVAPLSITSNGTGVSIDNVSITHASGELTVSLVDGGAF